MSEAAILAISASVLEEEMAYCHWFLGVAVVVHHQATGGLGFVVVVLVAVVLCGVYVGVRHLLLCLRPASTFFWARAGAHVLIFEFMKAALDVILDVNMLGWIAVLRSLLDG